MTTSSHLGAILRLSLASALATCLLWPGTTAPVNKLKTSSTVNPLPELRGQAAVEHLKREGIYKPDVSTSIGASSGAGITLCVYVKFLSWTPRGRVEFYGAGAAFA